VEALDRHLELIAGRQYGREAEWLHFDGGTATLRGLEVFGQETELTGFAGSRVYFYSESSRPGAAWPPRAREFTAATGRRGFSSRPACASPTSTTIDNSLEMEARHDFFPRGMGVPRLPHGQRRPTFGAARGRLGLAPAHFRALLLLRGQAGNQRGRLQLRLHAVEPEKELRQPRHSTSTSATSPRTTS
jgi:hypothetical protein